MDHTSSTQPRSGEPASAVAEHAGAPHEASDSFPPRRISTLPPLGSHEAQESFLRSPSAVLESIGLRVPAALAQHIRRSSVPPPPAAPVASVEASDTPTAAPPARRTRASSKKKKSAQ